MTNEVKNLYHQDYTRHTHACGETYQSLNGALKRAVQEEALITVEAYKASEKYGSSTAGKEEYLFNKYCDFHAQKAAQDPETYYEKDRDTCSMYRESDRNDFREMKIKEKVACMDKGYTSSINIIPNAIESEVAKTPVRMHPASVNAQTTFMHRNVASR